MTSRQLDEEAVFHIARDLSDEAKRTTYLDQVCGGDLALRERVEALVKIHEQEKSFLESAQEATAPIDRVSELERAGTTIGRYRLMEKIGEGGMGTVFVAQQERPIRRKVALIVIKPGMDSKSVIARFEVERQALALMDHPNIARVLDAGTTDSGHAHGRSDHCTSPRYQERWCRLPSWLSSASEVCQSPFPVPVSSFPCRGDGALSGKGNRRTRSFA